MSFFKKIGKIAKLTSPVAMLLGGGRGGAPQGNPANAGMGYLNQIPGAVGEYYKPFIDSGQQAAGVANPIYGQMSQNPQEFINNIMRGYSPSEGFQYKQKYLSQGARNNAAAGGFLGTPESQRTESELINGILGQDMQEYLSNILGTQQAGLQGQENRIQRGFQAGTGYGDILGSNLGQQAGLGFQGASQMNQNIMDQRRMRQDRRNSLLNFLGGAGQAAAGYMGGR